MSTITIISLPNFFPLCWTGRAKLWQAFWLGAILGKVVVLVVAAVLGALLWHGAKDNVLVNILLGSILCSYLIFASVSVWRCAPNTTTGAFGGLARVWVVFSLVLWTALLVRAL